jgi:hypothetical protein
MVRTVSHLFRLLICLLCVLHRTVFYFPYSITFLLLHQSSRAVRVSQWYDRCSKLTSAPVTSEVVGSIPGQTRSSCDREGDSLWQRRFPPGTPVSSYMHYKSPNIVYGVNNVLVDAQHSTQYFKIKHSIKPMKLYSVAYAPLHLCICTVGSFVGLTSQSVM